MAASDDPIEKPHDWDKVVSAAYLRLLGHSQKEAAMGAGCGERSLRRWETCSWWAAAKAEASSRWLNDVLAFSRAALLDALKGGDADKALKVLERLDERLAPAKARVEHSGKIETSHEEMSDDELMRRASDLQNRIGALTAGSNGNGAH